jgi:hypothetical protein
VSFTYEPCHYDLTRDFVYPSCLIYPRDCHLHSCQSSSCLEVSYQWKLSASTWDLIKISSIQSTDETIIPRGLTDGRNIDGSLQHALGDRKGEAAWETKKFSSFRLSRYPPFSAMNALLIAYYAPLPFNFFH